jgi:hypothetical protein
MADHVDVDGGEADLSSDDGDESAEGEGQMMLEDIRLVDSKKKRLMPS